MVVCAAPLSGIQRDAPIVRPRATLRRGARARLGLAALLGPLLLSSVACRDEVAEKKRADERRATAKAETEAVLAKRGPEVRALVKKVEAAATMVRTAPRASSDAVPPLTAPPIKLSEPRMNDVSGNADVMFANELALRQRGMVGSARYYLRKDGDDLTSQRLEEIFARALRTRYLLVIRADERKRPKPKGGNGYTGGSIDGDVVVFDLSGEASKIIGAFPIETELTRQVRVRGDADLEAVQYTLDEALRETALDTIDKRLTSTNDAK